MRTLRFLVVALSLAVLCGTQTFADSYDPTQLSAAEILAKADAAGGKLEPGTYVEVRRQEVEAGSRTITTQTHADDWRTTVEGGGYTSTSGSYQGRRWSADANGIVRLRSGFRASDPNELALQHPDDPQYHVTALGMTQTQPRDYVVDVNPPNGIDVRLYYNAQTFLLDREVRYERDRYQHVAEYSDYRRYFGTMDPGRVHSYDGRPQNDTVETLVSFERSPAPLDLSIPDSKPLFTLDGTTPIVLPTKFTPGGIVIQAQIGGRGYDFILDSGASGLFMDPAVAHELGLTPAGEAITTVGGGDVDERSVRVPLMSIGPLQMHNVAFTTASYGYQVRGTRVIGLIGFDFIASAITEIDFKAKTLTLYPRSAFVGNVAGRRALGLDLDDGIPRVKASVEDVPGNFLVDTGAFMTLAYRDYVSKLPSSPRDPYTTQIDTVGGPINVVVLHLSDFTFGGIDFRSVDVVEPTQSTFDIMDYDGIIGRDALSAYRVTFDYADGIIFLSDNI